MNLNSIIFPAPTDDKTYELYRYKEEIIFVPKVLSDGSIFHIPCLMQQSKRKSDSNKFLFYFHGNAEDIFNSTSNLDILRNQLPVTISYILLAVQLRSHRVPRILFVLSRQIECYY